MKKANLSEEENQLAKFMKIEPEILIQIKSITGSVLTKFRMTVSAGAFYERELANYREKLKSISSTFFFMDEKQKDEYINGGLDRLRPMAQLDDAPGYEIFGISYKLQNDNLIPQLKSVRTLLKKPFSTFYEGNQGQAILFRTVPQFRFLQLMGTNAVNAGFENDKLIDKLKQWHKSYGLEIHGAGPDWLHLEFDKLPKNIEAFVAQAWELCPDLIDCSNDPEERKRAIELYTTRFHKDKQMEFWWD